jgi:hypothetical protein
VESPLRNTAVCATICSVTAWRFERSDIGSQQENASNKDERIDSGSVRTDARKIAR